MNPSRFKITFIFVMLSIVCYGKSVVCFTQIDDTIVYGKCKGVLKHGKFVGYYPSGITKWEVHYKYNVLDGRFANFYPDGNLHFSGYYRNGILDGKFTQYNKKHDSLVANFKKGVLHNWLFTFRGKEKTQGFKYYYGKVIQRRYFE